ncbi:MAG: FtsW/RodA/SpoVE family cell cycle protein, partial [Bacteroidales bacterium]|nr:FtsW/RodA/SpoVE family cell cycle protein [Bacteroidales bacterium]
PFISYGGTSLWISSFALGIVLNISRKENQKNKREKLLTTTGETIETEEDFMDEEEQTTSHDNKDSVRRKFEQRINETIEDESNN